MDASSCTTFSFTITTTGRPMVSRYEYLVCARGTDTVRQEMAEEGDERGTRGCICGLGRAQLEHVLFSSPHMQYTETHTPMPCTICKLQENSLSHSSVLF